MEEIYNLNTIDVAPANFSTQTLQRFLKKKKNNKVQVCF